LGFDVSGGIMRRMRRRSEPQRQSEIPGMERPDALATSPCDTPAARTLAGLMASRYSCRAFLPQPVPTPVIERMLTLAQLSASWCNSQPWQVIVTEGAGTERFRTGLLDYVQTAGEPAAPDLPYPLGYFGVYKERRRECGWQLYDSVGVAQGDREASGRQAMENFRLFGAPHAMIVTSERDLGTYGAVDCGLYVGNLLLAAESLGVATIAQAALARCSPFLHRHFAIPETRAVVCGVSFGYADPDHPANGFRTRRADISEAASFVRE
jgi:nitroreductase